MIRTKEIKLEEIYNVDNKPIQPRLLQIAVGLKVPPVGNAWLIQSRVELT